MSDRNMESDLTPATARVAGVFIVFVMIFIGENYFTASEYYVGSPPYSLFIFIGVVGGILAYRYLKKVESKRKNSMHFALLFALGAGLFAHPAVARLNILTDMDGIEAHAYTLGNDYVWRTDRSSLPDLDLYLHGSSWWQQFQPGDTYEFGLREGGLGIWMIDMTPIYEEQQAFYECHGVIECMQE